MRATDAVVEACPKLPDGVRDGWKQFSKAWRTFFDEEDSCAQIDQGEAYEADLARWQDMIAQYRCSEAPRVTPSSGGADDPNDDRWQGTLKTVAIAGAVIAVALGVRAVVK